MSALSVGATDAMGRTQRQTLLERMGGEPVLTAIIKGWYRRIFKEEELKRFFRNVDMKKVTSHQYELL